MKLRIPAGLVLLFTLAVGQIWVQQAQAAADRIAVVVGNTKYDTSPLANASNDAALVAEVLAQAGFEVNLFFDLKKDEFTTLIEEMDKTFDGAQIGVFYFAGHGFQVDGQNKLLSVDVDTSSAESVNLKAVQLRDVIDAASTGKGGGLRLIIIDACRDDPFSGLDPRFQAGLSYSEAGGEETLLAFSTSAGKLAFDGPAGGNGPYAIALSRAFESPGISLFSAFRRVRQQVRVSTEGLQIPWVIGSVEREHVLRGNSGSATPEPQVEAGDYDLDTVLWYFLSKYGTEDELERFVRSFPSSRHISAVRTLMRNLDTGERQVAEASRSVSVRTAAINQQDVIERARQKRQERLAFQPQTNIPAELFRLWPEDLPNAAGGLRDIVTACDLLAAHPADPQRVAPSIRDGLINIRDAVILCGFALVEDPGNPRLQFQLGRVLDVAKRFEWAKAFYKLAADQNYSAALTNLGYMYYSGRGSDVNYEEARRYYLRAASLGNLRARTNVGTLYIKGRGVAQQPAEGILWYRLASAMGWVNAQNALADLYRKGIGVEKNYDASAALYRLAAENGQREAMNSLGRSYLSGWGVEKDRTTAHLWLMRAIDAGDRFSPYFLARDLMGQKPDAAGKEKILELLNLSADRGFGQAYFELGRVHEEGALVSQDPLEAFFFYRIADLKKYKKAAEEVERLKALLSSDDIAKVEERIEQRLQLNGL
ncbi:Putative beta-lactamase HcpC precursor [Labrenzia sp. THAF82]|uniref:caspase family protein n=1 Tax=Labrenzia sp. THAF82 TaxID=2587861 RepID=UPI001267BB33|nr:caspase family protein [Labrenzia sp. THAF82]QFT34437.1 Putative beta-lactamase HcpC precursor [Labrenzia sp. THAF82]